MANLKEIRKRIATVKNTQKITRAMYLVAAARLRKAQENITRMRPYALSTLDMLSALAARIDDEDTHPLLARREEKHVMLIALSSDRGLAGAFNAQLTKEAYKQYNRLIEDGKQVEVVAIGTKGRDFFRRRSVNLGQTFSNVFEDLSYEKASEIGGAVISAYSSSKLDAVYMVYNEFKSAISQQVVVEPLLPIKPMSPDRMEGTADYIYEPSQGEILDTLLPLYVNVEIYRALLESVASEHGARMTAMDNATKNAKEMIDSLTLQANRARQAAITTELTEIISGAESLNA
ncbi:MAG: ATP synthase F1 subunit gamma [Myxococcales bacterium]|nr:ATP synthase F1 subunit gamma [Myxococcales bacterium]MDD9970592.1 ATP synthase F1 subunit gamma [Myxococcales bacterium]